MNGGVGRGVCAWGSAHQASVQAYAVQCLVAYELGALHVLSQPTLRQCAELGIQVARAVGHGAGVRVVSPSLESAAPDPPATAS